MIIFSDKPVEDCLTKLKKYIVKKNRHFALYTSIVFYKNEVVGNVDGNRFWISKTKIGFFFPISRAFEGVIYNEDGKTIIRGKFRYSLLYKIFLLGFISLISFLILQNIEETIEVKKITLSLLGPSFLLFISIGTSYLNTLIHKKDEQSIIELLQHICQSDSSIDNI